MSEIVAGTAVKHKGGYLTGRVRRVTGERAVCTWVRRHNLSWAYLRNLTPISDAELVAHFEQQEAMYDRIGQDPEWQEMGLAPPSKTSIENRLFLLEAIS